MNKKPWKLSIAEMLGEKNKGKKKKKSVGISILMYQSERFKVAKGKENG